MVFSASRWFKLLDLICNEKFGHRLISIHYGGFIMGHETVRSWQGTSDINCVCVHREFSALWENGKLKEQNPSANEQERIEWLRNKVCLNKICGKNFLHICSSTAAPPLVTKVYPGTIEGTTILTKANVLFLSSSTYESSWMDDNNFKITALSNSFNGFVISRWCRIMRHH